MKTSIGFYERLFGQPASKVRDDYANFRLDEPGLMLALVQHAGKVEPPNAARHFGVELDDGPVLARYRDRAEQASLSLRIETQVTCCYAVADKFWAADPDGNQWEFWVRTGEAESMGTAAPPPTPAQASCCAPKGAA